MSISDFLNKLACCCNSSNRKLEAETNGASENILAAAGLNQTNDAAYNKYHEFSENDKESSVGKKVVEELESKENLVYTVRKVILILVRDSTYKVIRDKLQAPEVNAEINDDFLNALEEELHRIEEYPEYVELGKVICNGYTPVNKALAEDIAYKLGGALVENASNKHPLVPATTEVNDADEESSVTEPCESIGYY